MPAYCSRESRPGLRQVRWLHRCQISLWRFDSFLLEAKRVGVELSVKDFEQLTGYLNSDRNTDIGILTNGIDYWVADNRKSGGLEDKKIYQFSLDEVTDCNLEILEYFCFPLDKIEKLPKKIELEKLKEDT